MPHGPNHIRGRANAVRILDLCFCLEVPNICSGILPESIDQSDAIRDRVPVPVRLGAMDPSVNFKSDGEISFQKLASRRQEPGLSLQVGGNEN
mmetsp:Transcript_13193/g.36469  ORF Transcript_13193/g.36469 Transcript_13193/m.36469 type:complete len:93 (-) Transcript_13193:1744-2022(-)